MGKTLDFTQLKKEYLTIKLNDEKKTVLMIGTPSKGILDEFTHLNETIATGNGADSETVSELYSLCAKIMSFNKGGIKITAKYLEEFFDIEDLTYFFREYGDFIRLVTSSKN